MPISLEVVTPDGAKLKTEVDELTAPSIAGEFGVLPGHLPILAALRPGVITWKAKAGTGSCAVGWGTIEVSDDHATVLTDKYAEKDDIDPVVVRAELKELDKKIDSWSGNPEDAAFHGLVYAELWASTRLELHGDPAPPTVAFVTPYSAAPDTALLGEGESSDAVVREE